jgi:hypothetical protein
VAAVDPALPPEVAGDVAILARRWVGLLAWVGAGIGAGLT